MIPNKSISKVQSVSLSVQGLAIGIILVFLALLSMDFGNVYFGFSFLPVAVIYYWPRAASYSWSLICVFLMGLFYDMASANTLGMWALAFVVLLIVLNGMPHVKTGLSRTLLGFALSVFLCLLIVLLVGWVSIGKLPKISTLLLNGAASIVIFPIIYWVRSIFVTLRRPANALGLRK